MSRGVRAGRRARVCRPRPARRRCQSGSPTRWPCRARPRAAGSGARGAERSARQPPGPEARRAARTTWENHLRPSTSSCRWKRRPRARVTAPPGKKTCHIEPLAAFLPRVVESELDLVTLLRARDPRGFELCYARHRDAIYGFLLRLSGQRAIAEDLFQETWLRLARKGAELRPGSDLRAWLFTVARNPHRSFLRARHPLLPEDELAELCAPDSAAQALELSELERALLTLPLEERELLLLVGVEGFAQDELAHMLGVAAPALRQRVTRARVHLAEALERGPASAPRQRRIHGR